MTDNRAHPAQAIGNHPTPAHWPKGVVHISLDGFSMMGVDGNGVLYWDGKPLATRKKITLTWFQGFIAVIAAVGSLMSGIAAMWGMINTP